MKRYPLLLGLLINIVVFNMVVFGIAGYGWIFAAPPDPVTAEQGATIGSQALQANVINWNTIILAFISLLTTIATTIGGIYLVRINSGQAALTKVTNDTHTLVNSNMGVQLKLNAAVTKRLAVITNNPDDQAAASLAQIMYEEHLRKQAVVDAERGGART